QRLPLLEERVNAYVPVGLKVARVLILTAFAVVTLDAWRIFDLDSWLASPAGDATLALLVHLLIIFAGAAAFWILLTAILEHKFGSSPGGGPPTPRQETLLVLIRNALAIVIVTMTAMVALSQIGVDIGPLIAGAGIIGLAVGFG